MSRLVAGNRSIDCKVVIFDKDGTLVDYRRVDFALAAARRKAIEKITSPEVADLWGSAVGADVKLEKIDYHGPLGTLPMREEVLVASTALYLKGYAWNEAMQLVQRAYDEADRSMKPPYGSVFLDGVIEALTRMKKHGLKLALASTDSHKRIVEAFRVLRVYSLFDVIVAPEDVAHGKPCPDMIFEVLKQIGCRAADAVMVGDSVSDMKMGKDAGIRASIGVLTGIASREDLERLADVVVDSVAQLTVA